MLKKVALPLLAALALTLVSAKAAEITFTIDGNGLPPTYTQTEGGITMTWTNPVSDSLGFTFGTWTPELGYLTLGGYLGTTAFNFSFDSAVTIVSFTIGAVNPDAPTGKAFTLSAPDSITTESLSLDAAGTFQIPNEGFTIGSGVVGTWSTIEGTSFEYPMVTLQSITVRTPPAVPEPSTYVLLGGASLAVAAIARRRQQAKLAV